MADWYSGISRQVRCPQCGRMAHTGYSCEWCGQNVGADDMQYAVRGAGCLVKSFSFFVVLSILYFGYNQVGRLFGGAQSSGIVVSEDGEPTDRAVPSSPSQPTALIEPDEGGAGWNTSASEHRGEIGRTFSYRCPQVAT